MTNLLYSILFLVLAILGMVLKKTYFAIPLRELKRRAQQKNENAKKLYRAAAYGNSLKSFLWLYIGLMSALSLILFARQLPVWLSILIVGPILWIVFSLIPATRTTAFGTWLAGFVSPFLAWLLNYLHPILDWASSLVESKYIVPKHTGLYERDDILELIQMQQNQTDSRIQDEELDILHRTLNFNTYKVRDILTPRTHVKTILEDDTVGPVLIDELHKNAQDFVLVRESKKGPFVGTLEYNALDLSSSGKVKELMEPTVYYLHENDSLSEALHAFFVTNHPIFIVINSFEEYIGIITIENIIQKLIGHVPGEDFDQYTDLKAVSLRHNKNEKDEPDTEESVKTDDEVVE
ncbi:MAG: CBS domain-containing protein [Candidatus Saccharimonadales bacterium]